MARWSGGWLGRRIRGVVRGQEKHVGRAKDTYCYHGAPMSTGDMQISAHLCADPILRPCTWRTVVLPLLEVDVEVQLGCGGAAYLPPLRAVEAVGGGGLQPAWQCACVADVEWPPVPAPGMDGTKPSSLPASLMAVYLSPATDTCVPLTQPPGSIASRVPPLTKDRVYWLCQPAVRQ